MVSWKKIIIYLQTKIALCESMLCHKLYRPHKKFIVISLGTGSKQKDQSTIAGGCGGLVGWIPFVHLPRSSILETTEAEVPRFLQGIGNKSYYLRIQDNTLSGTVTSVDLAVKSNLHRLIQIGEELMDKHVSKVDSRTGEFKLYSEETNRQALVRFARLLSENRRTNLH